MEHEHFERQLRRVRQTMCASPIRASARAAASLRRRDRKPPLHLLLDDVTRLASSPPKMQPIELSKAPPLISNSTTQKHISTGHIHPAGLPILPRHVRKDVCSLFEAFAAQQQVHVTATRGDQANLLKHRSMIGRQPSVVGNIAGRLGGLQPTKRSFEAVLRLYYRNALPEEVEAMCDLVSAPLERLVRGRWVAQTKEKYGSDILKAFSKADRDRSGSIDLDEFTSAVEAIGLSNGQEVRTLFRAADENKDGVLDLDEFISLVASSPVLSAAFGSIMKKACDRRERDEHERLATIFRDPHSLISPSGRRQRPSLIDLRKPSDVSIADITRKLSSSNLSKIQTTSA